MKEITSENIFEKIISGEIPSNKVYEDEHTLAFLDATPINKGHTLVVPKKKSRNIYDVSSREFSAVMETVRKLSSVIKNVTKADGINIGINNDELAGQKVFHLHVHIIPRFEKDGFEPWRSKKTFEEGEMVKIAKKIQSKI